jgi:hypothetical protein
MEILPGRELLGSRLEHPRPVAFLGQHPCRSNGHLVYDVGLGQLALEVSLPNALHGEVSKIVYAFTRHEPSPLKTLHQGREFASRVPDKVLRV